MSKVLIISGDIISSSMGGVGVRYWELARALAQSNEVTLACPQGTDLNSDLVQLVSYDLENGDLEPHASQSDVIVLHGFVLHFHPYLQEMDIPLAVDLYVPSLLESLVWHDKDDWDDWKPAYEEYLRVQIELIRAGDFFFCASERQRDYWLGWLHALKRVNPHTYQADPTLKKLIDIVPFGLPEGTPIATSPVLKGVLPDIDQDDKLILWSGGLWDWLDPLTLIRAVGVLSPQHPALKLYFMGTHHPNPLVTGMTMPEKAIKLSQELDLYKKSVFFGDWVTYEQRVNYLVEADLGVISHPSHIETHFSFRTRVLDCIWAGIPLIITEGDAMAGWVENGHLGLTVPAGDVAAMAAAIEKMLFIDTDSFQPQAFEKLRQELSWERIVEPLSVYCINPYQAPDKGLYLTEVERIGRDKDAFLEQVIRDKDTFLEQVIRDKDAFLEQVVREKDAEREAALERYRNFFPFRVYRWTKSQLSRK